MGRHHLLFYPGEYVKIAKDLCYPEEYIEKIKHSKTENEAIKWMTTARLSYDNIKDNESKKNGS